MTLDEAIKHAENVALNRENGLYDAIALGGQNPSQEEIDECMKCAEEHRQLAEWLKELKRFQWISVEDSLPEKRQVVLAISKESKTWDVGMFQGLSPSNNNHVWWWKKKTVKRVDYWMPKDAVPLPYEGGETV